MKTEELYEPQQFFIEMQSTKEPENKVYEAEIHSQNGKYKVTKKEITM